MGFVPSPWSQRLLDLALEIMPNVVTDTITRTPKTNLKPLPDLFQCSQADMADISDALTKIAGYAQTIKNWPGTGMALANAMAGLKVNTIDIGCGNCKGTTSHDSGTRTGRGLKYYMDICAKETSHYLRQPEILLYVFLEVIALAGGNAVDQALYVQFLIRPNAPPGYIPGPGPGFLCEMKKQGKELPLPFPPGAYAGTYMVWDSVHGGYYTGNHVNPDGTNTPVVDPNGTFNGIATWQMPMNCPP